MGVFGFGWVIAYNLGLLRFVLRINAPGFRYFFRHVNTHEHKNLLVLFVSGMLIYLRQKGLGFVPSSQSQDRTRKKVAAARSTSSSVV